MIRTSARSAPALNIHSAGVPCDAPKLKSSVSARRWESPFTVRGWVSQIETVFFVPEIKSMISPVILIGRDAHHLSGGNGDLLSPFEEGGMADGGTDFSESGETR